MRLKATMPRTGIDVGQEFDRPEHIAIRLIEAGEAVPVAEPKVERAVQPTAKVEKRKAKK